MTHTDLFLLLFIIVAVGRLVMLAAIAVWGK
jgi:hypothetical protein